MLQIEASTPKLTGNSSILPDIAEDLQPNKYTNNYSSPPENVLKTNEISSTNSRIELLASNHQILDKSPETPPQPDINTFILNKNPTPTTNNIPEKPQISTTQTDPITGDTAKPATQNNISFDSGIFQADETGKISFDYLSDGGRYQGELAIISLTGIQEFVPDSEAFIKEAARRALSNSSLGYIAISDSTEAAKFSSFEGENNFNIGEYRGIKTFAMTPGDELGIIVVPNGTIQQLYDNPGIGGDKKPLFSMATANSSDAFQRGQIASVANGGSIFVMEDMGIGEGSDADYNDIIFSLKGATPKVISMDDVIAKKSDWRTSEKGKELIGDAAPQTETKLEDQKADTTSATNPVETKPENFPATETKNPTVSENPNSATNPAQIKTDSPAVETKNPTVSENPSSATNPAETKTDSPPVEAENPTISENPNSGTNSAQTKTENSSATETENPTISENPNSATNPAQTKTDSPAVEAENPTVSENPNSGTNPAQIKTENSSATETENPTISQIPNSATNKAQIKTDSPAVEPENPTISENPNSATNPVETKTDSPAVETKNPTISENPNSATNPVETKTENSSATETENPTISENPNSATNPAQTQPEKSPAVEAENPTVSQIPKSATNSVQTKTENSPAAETENPTISEIPNSATNPVETKPENSPAGETENPTISENIISTISENTQPAIVNVNSIDFITGDKIEIPLFIQADKPEIPATPAESIDILTGEIENISRNPIDRAEIASQTPENFPLLSPEEISQLSETLNSILAQQFPLIPETESSQNHQPSASEYIVTDAQTIIPEIAVTENHHSQQSENITADSDNQQQTTIDEYVNPDFDSQNIAITPEIPSEENNQPDNSQNIIADSFIATATDSDSETTINEYTVTNTETQPEITPNLPQQNQPLIGIIDTGFTANNPNINYSQVRLGKDLIEGDNNPLLQPNQENQHGDTILEIISHSNNQNATKKSTPIWLGRATGSGKWHQSLIEFVDAAKASSQPNAVVNLSFDLTQINPDGTQTTRHKLTAEEKSALKYAQDNNILIVAAAGNQGDKASALGQASTEFDNIITVGASENNNRSAYSSYGEGLDILAQISIPQTAKPSTTETKQGTSIAAAFVTNTLSQMWAANPSLSRQQIKNILLKTASDIDVPGWDERTGYGILNRELAIATAIETIPTIPVLAATKHLTRSLIHADANTSNSPNHTAAKPSERPALTNAAANTPKTTSTSTGDNEEGTSSYTTELAPNTTTTTSNSNGTTITNSQTNSHFSNTESSWDKSTVNTNSNGNSFNESTSDSSTNAATYTSKNFSQNSVENTNQSQENYSRVKYEGTRNDQSSSNQKSRSSSNYTTPSQTTNTTDESYRNSKSQSDSKYGTDYSMNNGKRQDDWGSKSTSNTRNTSSTGSSVNNSSTQVQGKADWTNSSNNSSSTNTHSGEENQVNRSNSESSSSSGPSKTNNSSDNYSVINSTWDHTTTDGQTVGSNSRDVYSKANSNANSSYDDGKSKNTSNTDTYTVNYSQATNSSNGRNYWNNNRDNNYSVTQSNDTQNYKDGPSTSSHNRDTYSVSKSNSSSSNSEGKVSSNSEQENYSENHAQWESQYKADTYTTQSNSDESTITATKSNSSTEGSNSTSSNSSDTSTTRNSQTVTTYQDGQKTENGSSSYEKWLSESSSDSKGIASSVSKYSSWSESYSKSYFKGGYSWTETVSGSDSESVTKAGVSTSNGSSWSWTRSGTVWDDGPNNWSESWSKYSWEDGKYAPGESEVTRGSFDPKGTGTERNNLPEFGEAPRLNKAPKKQVPPDFVKPPKPSDDIWQLPSVIFKEPQLKDVVFGSSGSDSASGESGNDDLANNPSGGSGGGSGKPDVSKMSFLQKLKAAIQLVPGLLVGDAKAAFERLVNDPQFLPELIGVGLAFAALQAVPGVGQAINAILLILFGASAAVSLGNFLLKTWQAKNEQDLLAAANELKNFVEAVGVLALTAGLKLAGRLLRSIRTGSPLPSPPPLRFGSNDLVYGPTAGGRLRQLQQRAGGKTLTDAVRDLRDRPWIQASIDTMEEALRNGHKIHLDLTNVEDIHGILNNTGKFANTITAQELRYIRQNWSRTEVKNAVKFYVNDVEVSPPW